MAQVPVSVELSLCQIRSPEAVPTVARQQQTMDTRKHSSERSSYTPCSTTPFYGTDRHRLTHTTHSQAKNKKTQSSTMQQTIQKPGSKNKKTQQRDVPRWLRRFHRPCSCRGREPRAAFPPRCASGLVFSDPPSACPIGWPSSVTP